MTGNYNDDPEVVVRSYFGLAILALICVTVASIVAAIAFGPTTGAVLLLAGMIAVPIGFVVVILNERAHYHYRQNLQAEAAAEREKAVAALGDARARALIASTKPTLNTRLLPEFKQPKEPRVWINGIEQSSTSRTAAGAPMEIVSDRDDHDYDGGDAGGDVDALRLDDLDTLDGNQDANDSPFGTTINATDEMPPPRSIGGLPGQMTESQADHAVRIRSLAIAIWEHCRDAQPSRNNIKERIGMSPGGLLRGHQDITEALDELARRGLVTHSTGQGSTRRWIRPGQDPRMALQAGRTGQGTHRRA